MKRAQAYAKINLALVVGPLHEDGKHELVTVLQRIDLADDVAIEPADTLTVVGFEDDTLVRGALEGLAEAAGIAPRWRARIEKRIPVSSGLGGGSSDAASALALTNSGLTKPLTSAQMHAIAASIGADIPFFLREGTQLATGDGTELERIELPLDYVAVIVLPDEESKESTAAVYGAFDRRNGAGGFDERRAALLHHLAEVEHARDLRRLPRNDLTSSPVAEQLEELGAFRADVSGAGPAVYGLFEHADDAERAAEIMSRDGETWMARPL
ncbi:MAG: 4-(cytidine 5'-diphospho)-2-C-methyl-D-erythritol kinase [Gaiellaceae bacterium]